MEITDVEIKGCTGPPCVFKKGENATVNVKFTSSKLIIILFIIIIIDFYIPTL